ncbi:MAG: RNA methyltransferase, partial [Acidobacteriota bacterium]
MLSNPILTSKDNPLVRAIRLAATRARRSSPELVVAEGLRVLEEATIAGCVLEAALIEEGFGTDPRERALLDAWSGRGFPVRRAAASVLKGLSDVVSPQGALALARIPILTLTEVENSADPMMLCLCGIQDPGNLGTLLRTARAAGVTLVCCTLGTVSARNPKAIRASAGSFFHIPIIEALTPEDLFDFCRRHHITVHRADVRGERSCWTADLRGPTAILLGNEARGLEPALWRDIPSLRIPMISTVESLNVS